MREGDSSHKSFWEGIRVHARVADDSQIINKAMARWIRKHHQQRRVELIRD